VREAPSVRVNPAARPGESKNLSSAFLSGPQLQQRNRTRFEPSVADGTESVPMRHYCVKRTARGSAWSERIRAQPVRADSFQEALANDSLSVRTEYTIAREWTDEKRLDRIDIVVSGPRCVLVIENKIRAREHDAQTRSCWAWLDPLPLLRRRRGGRLAAERSRIIRTVLTVPLPLPRFWLAAMSSLGEVVHLSAPVPDYYERKVV
jgi:hypothetical protein